MLERGVRGGFLWDLRAFREKEPPKIGIEPPEPLKN
jgi:hypothetical protein